MDTHGEWVARDAAVVWHGFTQMSTFAASSPVMVDHADGHELVDVDGKRYLDAISSLRRDQSKFAPRLGLGERDAHYTAWRAAVARTL